MAEYRATYTTQLSCLAASVSAYGKYHYQIILSYL